MDRQLVYFSSIDYVYFMALLTQPKPICVTLVLLSSFLVIFCLLWLFPSSGVAGIGYFPSTLSCPLRPPPSAPHFPRLYPRLFPVVCTPDTLLSTHPSFLLFTCPSHSSLLRVIILATGSAFTDPYTCSFLTFLIVTPHIHPPQHPHLIHLQSLLVFLTPHVPLSILISSTSSLYWSL